MPKPKERHVPRPTTPTSRRGVTHQGPDLELVPKWRACPSSIEYLRRDQSRGFFRSYLPRADQAPPAGSLRDRRHPPAQERAAPLASRSMASANGPHGPCSRPLGLKAEEIGRLNDDGVGRALDRLFLADVPSLVLAVAAHVVQEFGVRLDELHNDSTTVSFCRAYANATVEQRFLGHSTLAITFGHNKDHRPDLKQLLLSSPSPPGRRRAPLHFRDEAATSRTTKPTATPGNSLPIDRPQGFPVRGRLQVGHQRKHGLPSSTPRSLRYGAAQRREPRTASFVNSWPKDRSRGDHLGKDQRRRRCDRSFFDQLTSRPSRPRLSVGMVPQSSQGRVGRRGPQQPIQRAMKNWRCCGTSPFAADPPTGRKAKVAEAWPRSCNWRRVDCDGDSATNARDVPPEPSRTSRQETQYVGRKWPRD